MDKDYKLNRGDVVQIDPDTDPIFGGCFAVIWEKTKVGAIGYVEIPGKRPMKVIMRFDQMAHTDRSAAFVRDTLVPDASRSTLCPMCEKETKRATKEKEVDPGECAE